MAHLAGTGAKSQSPENLVISLLYYFLLKHMLPHLAPFKAKQNIHSTHIKVGMYRAPRTAWQLALFVPPVSA